MPNSFPNYSNLHPPGIVENFSLYIIPTCVVVRHPFTPSTTSNGNNVVSPCFGVLDYWDWAMFYISIGILSFVFCKPVYLYLWSIFWLVSLMFLFWGISPYFLLPTHVWHSLLSTTLKLLLYVISVFWAPRMLLGLTPLRVSTSLADLTCPFSLGFCISFSWYSLEIVMFSLYF